MAPIAGLAADRELVPEYPGITESENLSDWDPPFPIDLERVRKEDEDYWHQYRTTPKAFIPISVAQNLWGTRFGKLTSIRIEGPITPDTVNTYGEKLRQAIDPALMGVQIIPVRDQGQAASRGATDFGEYFLYFSFFLVVSALMLTTLFFKLGIEQRAREVGTLQAIGFSEAGIRRLFLVEGTLLAVIGSLLGLVGAIAYAALLMHGLRTWWVDAVGTTALTLHVSWKWMALGAFGGVAAAVVCIFFTLRRLGRSSTRSLLAGSITPESVSRKGAKAQRKAFLGVFAPLREKLFAIVLSVAGIVLLIAGALQADSTCRRFLRRWRGAARRGRALSLELAQTQQEACDPRRRLVDHRSPRLSQRHLSPRSHRPLHHTDRLRRIHHRRRRFFSPLRRCGRRSKIRNRRLPTPRRVAYCPWSMTQTRLWAASR